MFWGGDTAQTISVGSSFRFEDLKALMWREEVSEYVAYNFESVNPSYDFVDEQSYGERRNSATSAFGSIRVAC